mmetsp:Transcript_27736/g.73235  ORF Transcript_27736/g.73235 Transcript_27736/m.73235 type:complete len:216 (+) Transcript_27736:2875-3522(+)
MSTETLTVGDCSVPRSKPKARSVGDTARGDSKCATLPHPLISNFDSETATFRAKPELSGGSETLEMGSSGPCNTKREPFAAHCASSLIPSTPTTSPRNQFAHQSVDTLSQSMGLAAGTSPGVLAADPRRRGTMVGSMGTALPCFCGDTDSSTSSTSAVALSSAEGDARTCSLTTGGNNHLLRYFKPAVKLCLENTSISEQIASEDNFLTAKLRSG